MDYYKETFETLNKVASLYQDRFMDLEIYNNTYNVFCEKLSGNNPSILEVGCGPGNISKYLISKRPDLKIHGIDVAPNMIELAIKNNPTASFSEMDCRSIMELKTKYDGIVCGFCIPYLSPADCTKFIADCSQLLLKEGLFYISFVEGEPSKSGFQTSSSGDRSYFYFYKLNDLCNQLLENAFHSIQVLKVEFSRTETQKEIHTILIARKI